MSFLPYSYYADSPNVLSPAHYLKIGGTMYVVIYPRGPFRRRVLITADAGKKQSVIFGLTSAGAVASDGTQFTVGGFAGDVTSRQIVQHLRFIAFSKNNPPVTLGWMDLNSLVSEILDEKFDATVHGPGNPLASNVWSFDPSMTLTVNVDNTKGSSQDFQEILVDMVEYKVAPTTKLPSRYILLTERGFGTAPLEVMGVTKLPGELFTKPPQQATTQAAPAVVVKQYGRR